MKKLPLILIMATFTGCATSELTVSQSSRQWTHACYLSLEQDMQTIAAEPLQDCGFSSMSATQSDKQAMLNCVQNALESDISFKAGYEAFGDDSRYCTIAIKDNAGTLWNLFFDDDVTGQFGLNGDHSAIWVRRCKGVALEEKWFDFSSCKEDREMVEKVFSSRDKTE